MTPKVRQTIGDKLAAPIIACLGVESEPPTSPSAASIGAG